MSVLQKWAPVMVLLASGCTGIPPDRGINDVSTLLRARAGDAFVEIKALPMDSTNRVSLWLDEKLGPETAVRIGLVNNPQLRAAYAELGIAAAAVYDAGRLSNPRVSFAALDSSAIGTVAQLTLGFAQNITDLILLNPRRRLATAEAERMKYVVGSELFNFAVDVVAAYFGYLGAEQTAAARALAAQASAFVASLAAQYFASGNINQLALNEAEVLAGEMEVAAVTAAADLAASRIELNRLLGLTSDAQWRTPTGLPLPVVEEDPLAVLQELAITQRLDLQAASSAVALNERAYSMTRRYRFLGEVVAGVEYERETDRSRLLGPTVAFELPIFNRGDGRLLRAQATLEQQQAALASLQIAINSDVARAHNAVAAARKRYEVHQQRLLPARQRIVAFTFELQNYMLASPFELLDAKRTEYEAYVTALQSLTDYWLARADLSRAVGAKLPSSTNAVQGRFDFNSQAQRSVTDLSTKYSAEIDSAPRTGVRQ